MEIEDRMRVRDGEIAKERQTERVGRGRGRKREGFWLNRHVNRLID